MESGSRENKQRRWTPHAGALLVLLGAAGLVWSALRSYGSQDRFSRQEATRSKAMPRGNWTQLVGTLLLGLGIVSLGLAALMYFVDPFAGDRVLPGPVALAQEATPGAPIPSPMGTPVALAANTPEATAAAVASTTPAPTATPSPTRPPAATAVPLDPGSPVRMIIPRINLDSKVKDIGTYWEKGQLAWETVPFLVGHYRTTANAGEKGNGVFSGHVTSRNAGNVFADLYQIQMGDDVRLFTDENEFDYQVFDVKLVLPTETSVMDPTPDGTITLITCAGEWLPAERNYTHRLIVSARLKR